MKINCNQKSVCIRSERTEIEFCRKKGCIVEIRDSLEGKKNLFCQRSFWIGKIIPGDCEKGEISLFLQ